MGSAIKIGEYLGIAGISLPFGLTVASAIALSSLEFMLGANALVGTYRKLNSRLLLWLVAFMTGLTLYLAIFNPVKDCGCFGDAIKLTNWQTFGKNVVLLLASIVLAFNYRHVWPLTSPRMGHVCTGLALAGILSFSFLNYRYLPAFDFRPFKVGANFEAIVTIPQGEQADIYDYVFVYEQDGLKEDFPLDSLPDSTWAFVERRERLVKKGYQPPVPDFAAFTLDGEDVTKQIIEAANNITDMGYGGMILVLSPKLSEMHPSTAGRIEQLQKIANKIDVPFGLLTGSDENEINAWRNQAKDTISTYISDATILKTMARANPSLMVLSKGLIAGKYSFLSLPKDEATLASFVQRRMSGDSVYVDKGFPLGRTILLWGWAGLILVALIYKLIALKSPPKLPKAKTRTEDIARNNT